MKIVLASGSATRIELFRAAGLEFETAVPRLDEEAIKASLSAEGAPPRDVADALAEAKARKIAARHPEAVTFGADQVLDLDGTLLSKPADPARRGRRSPAYRGGAIGCTRPSWPSRMGARSGATSRPPG